VCDRYAYSGVAFSAAKKGIDFEWCKECDRGLPKPDAVLFLDLAPEKAAERGQYGEERYETKEMQARVRANFARILAEDASAAEGERVWSVVDAGQTIEAVTGALESMVLAAVKKAQAGAPLAVLWPKEEAGSGGGSSPRE
jgi:dTMP kinase